MTRRAVRLAVTTILVVAAWVGLPVTTAQAADGACTGRTGVTVVVDFNQLGGGVQGTCVADGGGDVAYDLFVAAGFPVNINTPQNRGYACQVSSKPAGCGLPDGDRYWGLWWADGKKSTWTYSSAGVGSLEVPDGGYVAFAWDQNTGDTELPSYTPAVHTAAPSPPPSPTQQPTREPTATPTSSPTASATTTPGSPSSTPTTSSSATPSATPSASPTPTDTATPTQTESPTDPEAPTPGATPTDPVTELADPVAPTAADDDDDDDDGLPVWVAPILIVVLLAGAGGVAVLRRRQSQP